MIRFMFFFFDMSLKEFESILVNQFCDAIGKNKTKHMNKVLKK